MTAGTAGGRLLLVATPIGNLGDVSARAVEALRTATLVCCEDTRRTGLLLHRLGIDRPDGRPRLLRVDDHTEQAAATAVLEVLATGGTVAVVTDAGTPGIADPGERLVRAALAAGHEVATVPGPSAAVAALVVSGLPTGRFVMDGFLPRKGDERTRRLAELRNERRTIVLYEAPHRLARTLRDLAAALGEDRPVAVCRELTKLHEEVWRGTLGAAAARAADPAHAPRGEYVLVIGGAPPPAAAEPGDVAAAVRDAMAAGADRRSAAAEVARRLGVPRRVAYQASLGTGGGPTTQHRAGAAGDEGNGPTGVPPRR